VDSQPSIIASKALQWLGSVMGRIGTPFPHLQFMTQRVPPPQIVIMLEKGTRPLSGAQP